MPKKLTILAALTTAVFTTTGCSMYEHYFGVGTPEKVEIAVAFRAPTVDGHSIRRVAVLPFRDDTIHPEKSHAIQSAFVDALSRRQLFDAVALEPTSFTDEESELYFREGRIGKTTLMRLTRDRKVDAVLFGVVTRYRAYEPMSIGLRITMISSGAGDVVWEATGLYDAARVEVAQDVHHWYDTEADQSDHLEAWRGVLMSPTQFAQYVCSRMVDTW